MGNNLYIKAAELLASGQKLVLARIIKRSGSTPRDVGSACIMTQDKQLFGTVGGGLLEHKVQQKSMELIETGTSYIYRFKLSNDDLAKGGMICGGNVDLFLEPLFPSNELTVKQLEILKQKLDANQPCILASRIEDGIDAMAQDARLLITEDKQILGALPGFTPDLSSFKTDFGCQMIASGNESAPIFIEKITVNPQIVLFGAGHVSKFVVQLAKLVNFDIIVIDDRQEFANTKRFPDADQVCVRDFENAFKGIIISPHCYILIITRGHIHDKIVLEQALKTPAAYIGMIGSTKKRDTIYKALMASGVSKEKLAQVYSPVGLEIDAQTPEEIAVSIVGQLIQKRAGSQKKLIRIA